MVVPILLYGFANLKVICLINSGKSNDVTVDVTLH